MFTGTNAPAPLEGEENRRGRGGIRAKAVRVVPNDRGGFLDPLSRINLGKVIPVDIKSRVRDWGWVDEESLDDLKDMLKDVNTFWERKNSTKSGKKAPQGI